MMDSRTLMYTASTHNSRSYFLIRATLSKNFLNNEFCSSGSSFIDQKPIVRDLINEAILMMYFRKHDNDFK
jgi:hypothetical protein